MKRYIALLRGINISGKNKISMAELKTGFAEAGYTAVSTYLNSGNVAFDSDAEDKGSISENIMAMIKDRFKLDIPVLVILQECRRSLHTYLQMLRSGGEVMIRIFTTTSYLCSHL